MRPSASNLARSFTVSATRGNAATSDPALNFLPEHGPAQPVPARRQHADRPEAHLEAQALPPGTRERDSCRRLRHPHAHEQHHGKHNRAADPEHDPHRDRRALTAPPAAPGSHQSMNAMPVARAAPNVSMTTTTPASTGDDETAPTAELFTRNAASTAPSVNASIVPPSPKNG